MAVKVLRMVDGLIRGAVKKWLHLPSCTCDGLLYSRVKDGGLGVVQLARFIPSAEIRRIYRLSISEGELTRMATQQTVSVSQFERLWSKAGGRKEEVPSLGMRSGGGTSEAADQTAAPMGPRGPVPCDWRQESFESWCRLTTQGAGIEVFRADNISNCWLSSHERMGFSEAQYIAGLQLRANVYPTQEALARGRLGSDTTCRRCHDRSETCSHILSTCLSVQQSRMRRHNKVCDLLAEEATRAGWTVAREFRVRSPTGELRVPDLVFKKADLALVVDVTVRYEVSSETLENARREKVAYYSPLLREISAQLGDVRSVRCFGFPVGARGKWPKSNFYLLAALGVSRSRGKQFAKLVSRRVVLYSLDVLGDFTRPFDLGTEESDEEAV